MLDGRTDIPFYGDAKTHLKRREKQGGIDMTDIQKKDNKDSQRRQIKSQGKNKIKGCCAIVGFHCVQFLNLWSTPII